MAAEFPVTSNTRAFGIQTNPLRFSNTLNSQYLKFSPISNPINRKFTLTICCIAHGTRKEATTQVEEDIIQMNSSKIHVTERLSSEKSQLHPRDVSVLILMSSLGIISMVIFAVYYRFLWQMESGDLPLAEIVATFAVSVAAAVGMEFFSRWVHREVWHASLWYVHKSHHRPREGTFEFNDLFAIINSFPAIALLNFGFFHEGLIPGLCFGTGLGMTVLGMAYIFVHNGVIHQRFPVGPFANVPYFHKLAAAHQIHHSDKFDGVPYGLFLGHKELQEIGGMEELEKEIKLRVKRMTRA